MIPPGSKPALAAKARLRLDAKTGSWLLLYPERGLALSSTAASILRLCSGELTVEEIVEELRRQYGSGAASDVRGDLLGFLEQMVERGLVEVQA